MIGSRSFLADMALPLVWSLMLLTTATFILRSTKLRTPEGTPGAAEHS